MIKDIEITNQEEKTEFDPIPADLYECSITNIQEKERPTFNNPNEKEKVIEFEFTITGNESKGRKLWKSVRPIVNTGFDGGQPSTLYQIIACVFGEIPKSKTFIEIVNSLEGMGVRVGVKQNTSAKGKTYNKITEFYPLKYQAKVQLPENTVEEIKSEDLPF